MKKILFYIQLFLIVWVAACNQNKTGNKQQQKDTLNKPAPIPTTVKQKIIVFFGNSLTAGYGLDPSQAFPALIQQKIDALHLPYQVVNAGVSGETTAGGLSRIDWILRQPMDVFVLELGGNDGLRGIPLTATEKNLQDIIDRVKEKYPSAAIVLAGMQLPPNLGQTYTHTFEAIYPKLAAKNHIALIPFLLEGVGGNPALNQNDGIHPNAAGTMVVAANVWKVLKDICK
ncbi:arylesterase [Hydrotalea sp.]|uniref:arylesterase n=1 Tax=Hydrotalea sp. TaxID=2881279 RepID=UPI0025887B4B|nr:arylesterase [Hydrotalea sp.]